MNFSSSAGPNFPPIVVVVLAMGLGLRLLVGRMFRCGARVTSVVSGVGVGAILITALLILGAPLGLVGFDWWPVVPCAASAVAFGLWPLVGGAGSMHPTATIVTVNDLGVAVGEGRTVQQAIQESARIPISRVGGDAEARAASVLESSFRARPLGRDGEWGVYAIGSRASLRMWGLWGSRPQRRLPLKVHLKVETGENRVATLLVRLVNDEGPYLVRIPAFEPALRRYYREIIETLRAAFN